MWLPEDRHFAVHASDELEAVWGYDEMVRSVDDFEALLESRDDAIDAFRRERSLGARIDRATAP